MKKKAVTISPSQLIGFLDQELTELPDNRKGDNKKYTVNHAFQINYLLQAIALLKGDRYNFIIIRYVIN